MDTSKTAFQLLTFLLSDNESLSPEKSNFLVHIAGEFADEMDFDPKKEIEVINKMSDQAKEQKFLELIKILNESESMDNKEAFLSYAMTILSVNTTINEQQTKNLKTIASEWKIDLNQLENQ